MKTRKQKIANQLNLIEAAMEALLEMQKNPDAPIDLSTKPVGALGILSKKCEIQLLFTGDNVFGIMDLTDKDLGREEYAPLTGDRKMNNARELIRLALRTLGNSTNTQSSFNVRDAWVGITYIYRSAIWTNLMTDDLEDIDMAAEKLYTSTLVTRNGDLK